MWPDPGKNCGSLEMISRKNWKLTRKYLEYRRSVDLLSEGSLRVEVTYVRHILEWAGDSTFREASSIRPTLPEYFLTARLDGQEGRLSATYIRKALSTARRFFLWLSQSQSDYRSVSPLWVKTLRPKRVSDPPKSKGIVTHEEVVEIAGAPAGSLVEERIRAAAVFWYLSGIRISAFVTLPIAAVDLSARTVKQFPSMGVRTKNRKHALTHLLNLPALLRVVTEWDDLVRGTLPDSGFWFAPISPSSGEIDTDCVQVGLHRQDLARKNLRTWLDRVGIPYHAPHRFRHGHIHYGIKHAVDVADFKAVSMNVMHSSMKITDEIYSRLSDEDIRARIDNLGSERQPADQHDEVFELFEEFLSWRGMRGRKKPASR